MRVEVKLPAFLSIFAIILVSVPSTVQGPTTSLAGMEFSNSLESFGVKLFAELSKSGSQKNIVFSPFSIQTCVAMARLGATGETAVQMDKGLDLSSQSDETLADNYHSVLSTYENSNILKIANKIYIMKEFEVQDKFNELLSKKFFTSAENIDFSENTKAAKTMNSWVESKTNNLIKDLISADALNGHTRLVLMNAIHFKGEWVNAFPEHATTERDFYADATQSAKVPMMHLKASFDYGDFPELDATALKMSYKDSDLAMLIILPKSRTGLEGLKDKLQKVSLHELTDSMYNTKVVVDMPKFKTEYEVELSDVLKKLGMERMFSDSAEFGNMLKSHEPINVSKVIHKAFIEVNEKGTETAAATGFTGFSIPRPGPPESVQYFNVDHGFYYMIVNKSGAIFFQGSQVKIA